MHEPRCLSPRAIGSLPPDLTIACFDTSFHDGLLPSVACHPATVENSRFVATAPRPFLPIHCHRLDQDIADPDRQARWAAHLCNGASLGVMRDGKSVNTTVGLTPLDGLMMGTRGCTMDPRVQLYLQRKPGMSLDDLQQQCSIRIRIARVSPFFSADLRI